MKYVSLTQVCDFQGGSQPPKDQWIDHEEDGYIRMLQIRDFTQPDKDNIEFVRINKTIKTCKEDDILIGRYGASVGKILTGLAGAYNVAIIKTIPDTSKLSKRFLYHYLNSTYFQNFILSVGSRAAQAGFNKDDLSDAQIPSLSLEEQKDIVIQLDKISELIALRKEQLAKLDQLVKSRFIELFGDPVTDNMKWGQVPLSRYLKNIRYGTSTPPSFSEKGYKFIRATNIKNGKIVDSDMKYISDEEAKKIEKCKVLGGEMIIVRSGVNAGDTCIITDEHCGQYAGYDMILAFTEELHPVFVNVLLNTEYMDRVVKPLTRRAAQPHLNSEQVQSLPIIQVPFDQQKQFAAFVEQTDKSKLAIQQSLDKLETLKKSLMQEYFG